MIKNHLFDRLFAQRITDQRPFLRFSDQTCWSYANTLALSAQIANHLIDLGIIAGDRVAVQVEKSPQALALYLACVRAGAIFLPLNTAYTASEVDYFIADAEPVIVVCDSGRREAYGTFEQRYGVKIQILDADGRGSLMESAKLASEDFESVPRACDDLAAILYTSGTTGRSKGVMLTHNNLLSNALVLAEAWQFESPDVLLHGLPIFHTHGLFVATHVIAAVAGSMWFLPKFDVAEILRLMPRASAMMGVPTHYTRLLERDEFDRNLASNMRVFICGSAPLLAGTHKAFEQRSGHPILERYGMTETSMNTSNPYHGERRAGSVGPPLPGIEVRITDAQTGEQLADGETGMIEVRGPNVFKGYWRMPEKTTGELRDNGYFITGDIGLIDVDGYVHIVGRARDLIISGGLNVYPKEIELALDAIDGVIESAVFGVPHEDFGEAVVAAVVASHGTLTETDLFTALDGRLARFKQPKSVIFTDTLPRNTMGKVQKNRLRERYANLFAGADS